MIIIDTKPELAVVVVHPDGRVIVCIPTENGSEIAVPVQVDGGANLHARALAAAIKDVSDDTERKLTKAGRGKPQAP